MKPKSSILITIVIVIGVIGGIYALLNLDKTPNFSIPWPTKGWTISTPEAQGMNSTKLEEMMDYIDTKWTKKKILLSG